MVEVNNPRVVVDGEDKALRFEVPYRAAQRIRDDMDGTVREHLRPPSDGEGMWEMPLDVTAFDVVETSTELELPREYIYPEISETVLRIPDDDVYIYIEEMDDSLWGLLRTEFSYTEEWFDQRLNTYHTEEDHIVEEWYDGGERMPKLPIGVMERLKSFLDGRGIEYVVIDEREEPEYGRIDYEWNFEHDLRSYQKYGLSRCLRGSCVVQWPTGAGKTLLALRIIYELGLNALILVNRKELLRQWETEIRDVLGVQHVGIIQEDTFDIDDVTVGMIQTLSRREMDDISQFDIFITDEVHHIQADTWYEIALNVHAYYRYGLSATAEEGLRDDDKAIKIIGGIGPNDIKLSPQGLIEEGYLAEPRFKWLYPERAQVDSEQDWHEVYREAIVENTGRNELIAREAEEQMDEGRRILIDVDRIAHGERLLDHIDGGLHRDWWDATVLRDDPPVSVPMHVDDVRVSDVPVVHDGEEVVGYDPDGKMEQAISMAIDRTEHPTFWVYGEDNDTVREYILDAFKQGRIECLVSTLLGEGVDIPSMNSVILASGGKSSISLIQTIGRSLRPENGDAFIVDLVDRGYIVGRHATERQSTMREYYGKYFDEPN